MDAENVIAEIRKLRKKLRQIENLERLDRPLNFEESQKVAKKGSLRSQIQQKLSLVQQEDVSITPETSTSTSSPDNLEEFPPGRNSPAPSPSPSAQSPSWRHETAQGSVGDIKTESANERMKRTHEESEKTGRDSPIRREQHQESRPDRDDDAVSTKRARDEASSAGGGDAKSTMTTTTKKGTGPQKIPQRGKSAVEKKREEWKKLKFSVQDLEGHNDLISSVDCRDNLILSGSRDTTVKAWNRSTGTERCSLGGHSGAVTSVYLLSAEENSSLAPHYNIESSSCHLALSSSTDCSVRLWDLDSSKELRSIYTFNAVTAMAYLGGQQCVVTGSDGGKVEMWDVTTGDNVSSSLTHEGGVTCIKVKGQKVATASADGVIKLWEVRGRDLHVIFESENIRSVSGVLVQRPIVSLGLGLSHDAIYYGDDGTNVKILDWKTGSVRKLKNHLGDFGSTDSMFLGDDLLLFSAYDLDIGVGSINFFSTSTNQYIGTVCDAETSRIEAISTANASDASHCFVTAGQELRVWRIAPRNQQSSGDLVSPTFDPAFTLPADDSEDDSSASEMSGDEVFAAGLGRGSQRRSRRRGSSTSESQPASWYSWCSLL